MRFLPVAAIAALVLTHSVDVAAEWIPSGVPLDAGVGVNAGNLQAVADGAGGAFVAWRDHRNGSQTDLYLQRITSSGDIAPGWPVEGFPLCVAPGSQNLDALVPDGEGGVFAVWQDLRPSDSAPDMFAQHVLGDGTLAPGWPVNGAPLAHDPDYENGAAAVADGSGGLYAAYYSVPASEIHLQRLGADGLPALGWPADGLIVGASYDDRSPAFGPLIQDGSGGVIVVWRDARRYPVSLDAYAQRVGADGSIAPGWPAGGMPIAPDRDFSLRVTPDGQGGFYTVALRMPLVDAMDVLMVNRFTIDGTSWPGWPAEGIAACDVPGYRDIESIVADGAGGLLLSWRDYRDSPSNEIEVYAHRLRSDGASAPGWQDDGTQVSDPTIPMSKYESSIAPDGFGGAYIAWESPTPSGPWPSFVQHLTSMGTVAPGWLPYGVQLAVTNTSHFHPTAVADGLGGAIVAWEEANFAMGRIGTYAQRFFLDGPVAIDATFALVEATHDQVVMRWSGPGLADIATTVERRGETEAWRSLGVPSATGSDALTFEDGSVAAGQRYAYRLAYREAGVPRWSTEAWVEVPSHARLALRGFAPNPAPRVPSVAFTLADGSPARLELLDVHGRRVAGRDVGTLGPGQHVLRLDGLELAPGIYHLRLITPRELLTARGVVVR